MLKTWVLIWFCCTCVVSCSGDPGEQKAATQKETAQEQLGRNMAEEIKAPLDQARNARHLLDDRSGKMEQQSREGQP